MARCGASTGYSRSAPLVFNIVMNRSDVVHQRSGADLHYGAVSLPIVGRELPEKLRLLKLHKSIGQLAHDAPDILELPEVTRALETELTHILVRCLAETVPGADRRRPAVTIVCSPVS